MKSANPLISIVIPTRANDAHTLSRLLLALMDQTYQTFEVLLVCDRRFTPEEWSAFSNMILSERGNIWSKLSENMRQKIRLFSFFTFLKRKYQKIKTNGQLYIDFYYFFNIKWKIRKIFPVFNCILNRCFFV